eukprot:TRINITY_DN2266_c0_g1_i11.p1 TRINITY_DN2266_c0_g1~~TRINITY_DN2266_c0_g1_i11.p1  ORF type:complete len:231 (+),score=3.88 TRINITY_DN2266_c0_g1_i11:214-906(+)
MLQISSQLRKIRRISDKPRSLFNYKQDNSKKNEGQEEITLKQLVEKLNQVEQDMNSFKDETRDRLSQLESKIESIGVMGEPLTTEQKNYLFQEIQYLNYVQNVLYGDTSSLMGKTSDLERQVNKIEKSEFGQKIFNVQTKVKDVQKKVNEIANKTKSSSNTNNQITSLQNKINQFKAKTKQNAQKLSNLYDFGERGIQNYQQLQQKEQFQYIKLLRNFTRQLGRNYGRKR